MDRRPLCLFCIMFMAVLIVLNTAGISMLPKSRDLRAAEKLLEEPVNAEISGIVDSCELRDGYGILTIKKSTLSWEGAYYAVGKVRVTYDGEERYACGWTAAVTGTAQVIRGPDNPGEFDSAQFYRVQNIFIEIKKAKVRILDRRTDRLAEALSSASRFADSCIREVYPEDVSGVLCSMLTGTRTYLDDGTRGCWQAGGIMHMLAISGLHIGILGMGIYGIIRKAGVPLMPAGIAVMSVMILYTVFVGCSVSSVRACIMFALMVTASYTGRTYDPMTALAAAAVLILLKNPEYMFYGGFQLSVAAVVLSRIFHKRSIWMQAVLLYLWMLPLVADVFFEVPLLSVPVNLIAVPLMPFIVGFGAAGCAGGELFGYLSALAAGGGGSFRLALSGMLQASGRACAFPAVMVVRGLGMLLKEISRLPCSVLITGKPGFVRCCVYFALLFGWTKVYIRFRLSRLRFLLLILIPAFIAVLAFQVPAGLEITFLSVGQGDGIVIKMYGDTAVITDCGSTSAYQVGKRRMEPYLRYAGIRDIPYMVATHQDEDHISGLREMLEMKAEGQLHMNVGALVLPHIEEDASRRELEELAAKAGVRVLEVQKGDVLRIHDVSIEILGPEKEPHTGSNDKNEQCIVFALHYRDFDALMTGDVTGAGEEAVTEQLKEQAEGGNISYEILKVAHHGSASSTPEEFLAAVCPKVSVISCGEGNRYGHPHKELLERLEAVGSRVYRTDRSGAVTVRTDGRRFAVMGFK